MIYFSTFILMAVIVYQWAQMSNQQRTIKDLNDRLMARSFTEYTAARAREDAQPSEQTSRKPLSWYDDPDIGEGDNS